jgi:hypothetical protein
MRTTLTLLLAAAAAAAPLSSPAAAQGSKDPTTAVTAAPLPAGWSMRLDDKDATKSAKFVTMGTGYHVTSGGAAIYWRPADVEKNNFTVSANFHQTKKNVGHGDHGEAYGVFIAGRDLDDAAKESYLYFEARQDGMYLINDRAGAGKPHILVNWTASPAVHKFDDSPNTNTLAIEVASDSIRFVANGTEVHAISRNEIATTSGVAGLRVNHNLDVHVADFSVKAGGR